MDAMAAIKQTFFQECEEQLAELESGLLAIEGGQSDLETINAVFRAVHSVKGGAGAFHLDDLVGFAHIFETTLDHVRGGKLAPTPELLKTMLRSADVLADLVRAARDGGTVEEGRKKALADELARWSGGSGGAPAAEEAAAEEEDSLAGLNFVPIQITEDDVDFSGAAPDAGNTFKVSFKPHRALYAKANDATLILRELSSLGTAEIVCDESQLPKLGELDPEEAYLIWNITLNTEKDEQAVREVFEFVDTDCDLTVEKADPPGAADVDIAALIRQATEAAAPAEAEPAAAAPAPTPAAASAPANAAASGDHPAAGGKGDAGIAVTAQTTIRVDLDRVDRLADLVGELVINQAMLAQRITEGNHGKASSASVALDELEQLTREIQESVMAIRAQPVKSVFQRMPRLAREVATLTGKSVRLIMDGEGTEVDKTVIERLADPLTHMIRNAIDHGLESPEKRRAAGKSEEGTVRLSAMHRSGRIVIEVADDGAGINRARVKQIAIDKGLIPADAQLTDDEVDNLIFLPGFSTASTVSNISGRGVGMDVVKRSVQALGGRISITSVPGKGSTFAMSLPLTLAVLDGMVVTVADQTLVVPLTAIVETLQPKQADVHGMGGDSRVIAIRDRFVPLVDVGQVLSYRYEAADPMTRVALLVETEGGARNALLVDAIQGQRQVVIKSLEANYGRVPGIAGATILGDGRVALIVDVDAVVADARGDVYRDPGLAMAS
ncbi:MAG: chemotaxis protein CheA [Hyphomicrobiales bacterium]|nr:MAG: chemotaxis protein CheA [Hyphomicrobiales bacterium]